MQDQKFGFFLQFVLLAQLSEKAPYVLLQTGKCFQGRIKSLFVQSAETLI